ncbi:MAG: carbohydrate-binding protein [Chloroflexota bacterium]
MNRKQPNHLLRVGRGIAAAASVFSAAVSPIVLAQTVPAQTAPVQGTNSTLPQSQIDTSTAATTVGQITSMQALTRAETEGPYYKTNSPEATNLVQSGMQGTLTTITGQVLDQNGQPVANALLDFWQANAIGAYDNSGYTLRGHQYTDSNGYYTLTTIQPGLYPGRTEHIHVKVQAPNSPVLTTQLFFPCVAQNTSDGLYDPSLLLNVATNADGTQSATFNFVVATA